MGLDRATQELALEYFHIYLYGLPAIYLFNLQGQIFNAHGAARLRTVIMLFALGLNIVLDPLLIFGYWGFPEMGIRGAAVATLISELLDAGRHEVIWQGRDANNRAVASGLYFCQLEAQGQVQVRKMLLLR